MPFLFQDILSNKKELKACVEAIEKKRDINSDVVHFISPYRLGSKMCFLTLSIQKVGIVYIYKKKPPIEIELLEKKVLDYIL
jgi:hypothetical protein